MAATGHDIEFKIRPYRLSDKEAVQRLYTEGIVGGKLAENDTGTDIDDIDAAYVRPEGNQLWVAETANGEIVGMIGVQAHDEGVGEIRRLRVAEAFRRRGIGSGLVETALKFCQERQYLKITLDTFMDREPAVKLFEKFRFRHQRTRNVGGRDLMYFYLDLYTGEKPREPA